jgi:hypothetical protein
VFVAVFTRNREMCADEDKARPLVIGDGENRRSKSFHAVAGFAPILMGLSCELARMSIFVAIHAGRVSGVIVRFTAHRQVALLTRHAGMLSSERIGSLRVIRLSERCRLEARFGMA